MASYLYDKGLFERPTAWVAHSLGGLVVKQILRLSELGDARIAKACGSTRAVTFLATPHRGAVSVRKVRRVRWFTRPSKLMLDLTANDTELHDLHDWFRHYASAKSIDVRAYRETQPVVCGPLNVWSSAGLIVDAMTADPGIAGALVLPATADHFTIAKGLSPHGVPPTRSTSACSGRTASARTRRTFQEQSTPIWTPLSRPGAS